MLEMQGGQGYFSAYLVRVQEDAEFLESFEYQCGIGTGMYSAFFNQDLSAS